MRIKDPQVVISKGAQKGKKSCACSKCHGIGHTIRTCPTSGNSKSVGKKLREEFNLNEAYITNTNAHCPNLQRILTMTTYIKSVSN